MQRYPEVKEAGENPFEHYIKYGACAGYDPNALFNAAWYLERYPEVKEAGANPLEHYMKFGAYAGYDPNALFESAWYLKRYPEVKEAGANPLEHYMKFGAYAGYDPNALFDSAWYLKRYPEVKEAGANPLEHYMKYGAYAGYDPNALFESVWYLDRYPEVREAGANPLEHYMKYGAYAGHDPNPLLDSAWYLERYPEVREAGANPLEHYMKYGAFAGYDPNPLFDSAWYLEKNSDVQESGINPLVHFILAGANEGRNPNRFFDMTSYLKAFPEIFTTGINPLVHYMTESAQQNSTASQQAKSADPEAPQKTTQRIDGKADEVIQESHQDKSAAIPESLYTGVISMVKNEADIIEAYASHILSLFDVIVFVDHGSEDGTRQFLDDLKNQYSNVIVYDLKEKAYIQALTMNFIISNCPQLRNVDWLFLLDADEFLPFSDRATFNKILADRLDDGDVIEMTWMNLVPTSYWNDKVAVTSGTRFLYPKEPSPYKKIAFQPKRFKDKSVWIDQGNHTLLSSRFGEPVPAVPAGFNIAHIPVRSANQLLLKLNQGVLSYLQLGKGRNKVLGSHWFKILNALKNQTMSDEILNGIVTCYGEDAAINPVSIDNLMSKGYITRELDSAFITLDLPPFDAPNISELLLRISGSFAAASDAEEGELREPERLELNTDNEIHRASDDSGAAHFQRLPKAPKPESVDNKTNDIQFLTDFIYPSYWELSDLTPSAWVGHLPFMFCLVDLFKPRRFVELGSHYGASFFAFCQAARRGGISTEAIAVDCWQGDEHAGFYDDAVFQQFKYILKKYSDIGSYLRMYFNDAAKYFEKNSIDLIHIDGLHTYEAVKEDYNTWLPKMSERGLMIFHDINVHERDFGVWRFWKEIKQIHQTMEFYHSHGLGIAYVGDKRGEPIEHLLSMAQSDDAHDFLQKHFEEISQKSVELFRRRWDAKQHETQFQDIGKNVEELSRLRQEVSVLGRERNELKQLLSKRVKH